MLLHIVLLFNVSCDHMNKISSITIVFFPQVWCRRSQKTDPCPHPTILGCDEVWFSIGVPVHSKIAQWCQGSVNFQSRFCRETLLFHRFFFYYNQTPLRDITAQSHIDKCHRCQGTMSCSKTLRLDWKNQTGYPPITRQPALASPLKRKTLTRY